MIRDIFTVKSKRHPDAVSSVADVGTWGLSSYKSNYVLSKLQHRKDGGDYAKCSCLFYLGYSIVSMLSL